MVKPRTLHVCHGWVHEPHAAKKMKRRGAETLDVDARTGPTHVMDITRPEFRLRATYERIVLRGCPNYVLFDNGPKAIQPLFRRRGDTLPVTYLPLMEQAIPRRSARSPPEDDDDEVPVVLQRSQDGKDPFLVAEGAPPVADPRDAFFWHAGVLYSNYAVVPVALQPRVHTWLNIATLLADGNGTLVIPAPMPRTYALMHGNRGGFHKTLRSLLAHICERTGTAFVHKAARQSNTFDEYVTGEAAPFTEYEGYDWHIGTVSVVERFTRL